MNIAASILDGPVPTAALAPTAVMAPQRGAVAGFIGVVRDHARGRGVSRLFYECYRPMAERVLQRLAHETSERFDPDLAIVVLHGTGAMQPGDVSLCIHAASAHRAPACDAVRHLLERIKQDLPIWKQQSFVDGEIEWVHGS